MIRNRFLIGISLFLLVFLLSSCEEEPIKIVFLGDSITIGSGLEDPETECYPSVIASMLSDEFGEKYKVQNFAVSGRTMLRNGDRPLWEEPQFTASLESVPDILYIMLGTNDSKPQNWDVSGEQFYSDYKAMLDTFLVINPDVKFVLAVPPPAFKVQWGIRDSVIVNGVRPVVVGLSKKYKTNLVNFYEPLLKRSDVFPDAIHPDAQGAKEMAKILHQSFVESSLIH